MSVYNELMLKLELLYRDFLVDAERFIQGVTPAEKALAVCIFGLVLMYFIIKRPSDYEDGGGMGRQFLFALTIVMLFGFGIGWIYSSDIELIVRSVPLSL